MPTSFALSAAVADAMCAPLGVAAQNGALVFYSDATARPAGADDAVPPGSVELARFALGPAPVSAIAGGVVQFSPVGVEPWLATGRLHWGRLEDADGVGLLVGYVRDDGTGTWNADALDVTEGDPAAVPAWSIELPLVQATEDES